MVIFDLFTITGFLYLLFNFIWPNLLVLTIGWVSYVLVRTGILDEQLESLSNYNEQTKIYYTKYKSVLERGSNLFTKLTNNEQYIKYSTILFSSLEKVGSWLYTNLKTASDNGEVRLRTNEKINKTLEIVEKRFDPVKQKIDEIRKIFSKIDLRQMYLSIKQMNEFNRQMQEMQRVREMESNNDDDDIFNETKIESDSVTGKVSVNDSSKTVENKSSQGKSISKNKKSNQSSPSTSLPANLPPLPPGMNTGFMEELLKSVPPEILAQSMKDAQNIDMSKVDVNKMMNEMNMMMSQLGNLQEMQKKMSKRKN